MKAEWDAPARRDAADTIQVSITVNLAINRVPAAEIAVVDGDGPNGSSVTDGDTFRPGSEIAISAGYEGVSQTIFKGIVVRQGIRIGFDSLPRLVVE